MDESSQPKPECPQIGNESGNSSQKIENSMVGEPPSSNNDFINIRSFKQLRRFLDPIILEKTRLELENRDLKKEIDKIPEFVRLFKETNMAELEEVRGTVTTLHAEFEVCKQGAVQIQKMDEELRIFLNGRDKDLDKKCRILAERRNKYKEDLNLAKEEISRSKASIDLLNKEIEEKDKKINVAKKAQKQAEKCLSDTLFLEDNQRCKNCIRNDDNLNKTKGELQNLLSNVKQLQTQLDEANKRNANLHSLVVSMEAQSKQLKFEHTGYKNDNERLLAENERFRKEAVTQLSSFGRSFCTETKPTSDYDNRIRGVSRRVQTEGVKSFCQGVQTTVSDYTYQASQGVQTDKMLSVCVDQYVQTETVSCEGNSQRTDHPYRIIKPTDSDFRRPAKRLHPAENTSPHPPRKTLLDNRKMDVKDSSWLYPPPQQHFSSDLPLTPKRRQPSPFKRKDGNAAVWSGRFDEPFMQREAVRAVPEYSSFFGNVNRETSWKPHPIDRPSFQNQNSFGQQSPQIPYEMLHTEYPPQFSPHPNMQWNSFRGPY